MKPYGSYNKKSKQWYYWGDKIPLKLKRYYNKATRMLLKKKENDTSKLEELPKES